MHGPIRDRLENLLGADSLAVRQKDVVSHLASCDECSTELDAMKSQSSILSALRAPEAIEPAAGFYARVLQKIEDREVTSFWSIFADSPFTKRVAFASLTVVLTLGGYVASQEMSDRVSRANTLALSSEAHYDAPVMGSQAEQRDAVLENFAAHRLVTVEGRLQ